MKPRKFDVCQRCQKIKYPQEGQSKQNHPRDHCSDGVSLRFKNVPYPMVPHLVKGKELDVKIFFQTLQQLYHHASREEELQEEMKSFAKMIGIGYKRLALVPGKETDFWVLTEEQMTLANSNGRETDVDGKRAFVLPAITLLS